MHYQNIFKVNRYIPTIFLFCLFILISKITYLKGYRNLEHYWTYKAKHKFKNDNKMTP